MRFEDFFVNLSGGPIRSTSDGKSKIEIIDSRGAMELLLQRHPDSDISAASIKPFAVALRTKTFIMGSQIRIGVVDGKETLIDGAKRLSAVVQSDIPAVFSVTKINFDNEESLNKDFIAFGVFGKRRTLLNALEAIDERGALDGLGGKKTAMGRAVGIIARDFVLNDKFKMPSRIIAEAAMEYSTCIEKMFEWGRVTIGGSTRGIYKSVVLAVALVTIRHCEQKAQHFWPRVVDGVGLAVGDSRLLLRDFIMRPQQGGSAIMFDVMTKTIGAWNHFYDNGFKPMSRLKGNVSVPHIEGTPYPLRNKGE